MQRVTITLDDELAAAVDRRAEANGYQGRSEAVRDLVRAGLAVDAADGHESEACVAALVYAYEHGKRELSKRLTQAFHEHHDLAVSSLHVHLDHDTCLEVTVLRGETRAIRHLAAHVIAERGVLYGRLVVTPVTIETDTHRHGQSASRRHEHIHVRRAP